MRRIVKLLLGLITFTVPFSEAVAETVTHKEAKTWAQTFFNAAYGEVTGPVKMVYNGKELTTRRLFTPFFVYNSPKGGFVIISAENKMFPILAYSLTDSFDPAQIDSSARALLKEYARQIELIRYDSTIPEQAIRAWTNRNSYINDILKSKPVSGFSLPDQEDIVQEFALLMSDLPFDDTLRSELYTPDQWSELVNDNLKVYGSVLMGVGEEGHEYPLVAVGKEGEYLKLRFKENGSTWNMLLFPSEVYAAGIFGRLGGVPGVLEEVEEAPFAFHDEIMEMYGEDEKMKSAILTEIIEPSSPVIRGLGAGHFEIDYPSEPLLVRVFNVAGQAVKAQTYAGTTRTAVINIEEQPSGFYVIYASGKDALLEPLKVAR